MSESFSITVPFNKAGVIMLASAAGALGALVGAPANLSGAAVSAGNASAAGVTATTEAPAKGKPGRKPKEPEAPTAPTESDDDGLGIGGGGSGEETHGDELGLDETPPAKQLTLAGDVIPAFRAALDRVGGDKTKLAKVLDGYGVKSVQSLPEAKFAEVIAKLAKLK